MNDRVGFIINPLGPRAGKAVLMVMWVGAFENHIMDDREPNFRK
jgi:hypothetical protein